MLIYGHRGAKGVAMENSLQGFQLAASQGIEYFELDVRLSSDNHLVVVHDEQLKRLANSKLRVSKSTQQILSNTHLKGTNQGIPTLEQVVLACPYVKHWQFEIKTDRTNLNFVAPMLALIDKHNLADKVTITSKHVGILRAFKNARSTIPRGYVQEWPLPHGLHVAKQLKCSMLVLNKSLARKSYVKRAQKKGLHVSVWTVNDADDMARLFRVQADSIISDYPQAAREVIGHLSHDPNAPQAPQSVSALQKTQ
ncbi:glycerophosphodiester phosphodiesterase [Bermanella marisrubri]|uniref:Glycerophosphoryl diester phosphodiesterase, putative n=1 Tax=Bermanella marisrubri TaxID=207949 RepID=Q1N4Y1_9GAMM|nr:glycerophosphodiester phosphodiesterase [Bermanella marisrubri]EAT13297.1 glycerophosphoryl diester phosphodiesterase, putative [Oceanobacter sp. RED65] [Bermanella marisrubri]QIZ84059.1 glycerophosphodiester phosphodiesterase [Bermanella marisrubri]